MRIWGEQKSAERSGKCSKLSLLFFFFVLSLSLGFADGVLDSVVVVPLVVVDPLQLNLILFFYH